MNHDVLQKEEYDVCICTDVLSCHLISDVFKTDFVSKMFHRSFTLFSRIAWSALDSSSIRSLLPQVLSTSLVLPSFTSAVDRHL